jgi:hypothetical protein
MLLPFFEWCEATFIGQMIRNSLWLFPVIESVHLLALSALGGAILIVDLRLLGFGLRAPVREVLRESRPWLIGSVVSLLVTGIALFLSESVKCYHNPSFWVKMYTLGPALVFTFAIKPPLLKNERYERQAWIRGLVALLSIGLWLTVAAAGRWIGFTA